MKELLRIEFLKGVLKHSIWADHIPNGDRICDEYEKELEVLESKSGCPHCKFISETFGEKMSNKEYWLMTEVFVYLHGTDECNFEK